MLFVLSFLLLVVHIYCIFVGNALLASRDIPPETPHIDHIEDGPQQEGSQKALPAPRFGYSGMFGRRYCLVPQA